MLYKMILATVVLALSATQTSAAPSNVLAATADLEELKAMVHALQAKVSSLEASPDMVSAATVSEQWGWCPTGCKDVGVRKGDKGSKGSKGSKGDKGADGADGAPGGPVGPMGPAGPAGAAAPVSGQVTPEMKELFFDLCEKNCPRNGYGTHPACTLNCEQMFG